MIPDSPLGFTSRAVRRAAEGTRQRRGTLPGCRGAGWQQRASRRLTRLSPFTLFIARTDSPRVGISFSVTVIDGGLQRE
jgi:hypothetical protein